MKKTLLILALLLVMGCLLSLVTFAAEATDGELTYTLMKGETEANNTAKIKSHQGKTFTETDIIIPAYVEYNGEQYRVIGTEAERTFQDTNITSVVFDDDIRWDLLSPHTFQSCGSLTTIDFGQSEIKKIGGYAFYNSEKLVLANNRMPNGLEELVDNYHFTNCKAMETLIFPESFTRFSADLNTAMSSSGILNLVFEGEMEHVYIRYINKGSLGGINIYLTKNTVSQLNGNYLETLVYDNTLYIKDGDYSTKTDGSLSFTLSANTITSSGKELTLDGVTYSKLNENHDRIYFCADKKVAFIVGMLTSGRFAVFEENALEVEGDTNPNVTNKLVPHFEKETVVEEANCLHGRRTVTYCYCGYIMAQETEGVLGEHNYVEGVCTECGRSLCPGGTTHVLELDMVYPDGFTSAGAIANKCQNNGCDYYEKIDDAPALFTCSGYSIGPNGYSLKAGFMVNLDAVNAYKEFYPSFTFGVVIVNANTVKSSEAFFVNEVINSSAKGIMVRVDDLQYSILNVDISNFNASMADSLELVVGVYTNDGEGNMSMCQHTNAEDYATTKTYSDMKLNAITFNQVRAAHDMDALVPPASTDEEVTQ